MDKEVSDYIKSRNITPDQIISQVTAICRILNVEHLSLFGSYAEDNPHDGSDIDFIVYGVNDIQELKDKIDRISTLTKIDIFDYDNCKNEHLRKDMDSYGKKIY